MTSIRRCCKATCYLIGILAVLHVLPGLCPPAARAESDPKALEIVEAMVDAHGGIYKWRNAPAISFEDEFKPHGQQVGVISHVFVEQGRRRAYLDYPQTHSTIVWDGERAWSTNWQMGTPPRFIARVNYYFTNLMFLTQDPGVNLEYKGTARLFDEPTEFLTVRMTFDPGVGDTPNDTYLLYIHPETKELRGCNYTVTYSSLLRGGARALPEKLLTYDEYANIQGLNLPVHYTIYNMDGSKYAECEFRDWSLSLPFDESRMEMPADAVIDTTTP